MEFKSLYSVNNPSSTQYALKRACVLISQIRYDIIIDALVSLMILSRAVISDPDQNARSQGMNASRRPRGSNRSLHDSK